MKIATFNVNSVNDPPTGADATVTTDEDEPIIFTTADFGFDDSTDFFPNDLLNAIITTLPTAGTLTLGGVTVTVGQAVSATDIAAGKLVYTPPKDGNGLALDAFTFQVQDDGGTFNGGIDLDPTPNTITINVNAINDAPTVTLGSNPAVNEDAGAREIAGFASFNPGGGADEATQTPTYTVKVTGTTGTPTFITPPSIDSNGKLKFTAAPNTNGTATIQVFVTDSGDGTSPNQNTSAPQTFTIIVNAVNDAPSITLANPKVVVLQNGGTTRRPGFASFNPGGGTDEAGQTPTHTLTNTNPGLFSKQPGIDSSGKLTFTVATGATGLATVTVNVLDSGGTANGGVNAGQPKTFTIRVDPVSPPVVPPPPPPPPVILNDRPQIIAARSGAGQQARVRILDATTRAL